MANCKGSVGSQFWRGVIKLKEKFFWGSVFMVNNGKKTKFWENIWINDYKLISSPGYMLAVRTRRFWLGTVGTMATGILTSEGLLVIWK